MNIFKIMVLLTLAASATGCTGRIVLGDLGLNDASTETTGDAGEEDDVHTDASPLDQ